MFHFFLAVLADLLKDLLVGAPLLPGFLIDSPEPDLILFRFACMFAYNPFLAISISTFVVPALFLS